MAQSEIDKRRLIVIGGSAGCLDIVLQLVAALPASTTASCIIVIHRKSDAESILAGLLLSKTSLPVSEVEDKDSLHAGAVYIAPPDYHLLLEDEETFSLDISEKVHFCRPSIDVVFQSAASVYGAALVGILLSGANADGAEGLKAVKEAGGLTIVQDPATADMAYMPQQAIRLFEPHLIASPKEMVALIQSFQ